MILARFHQAGIPSLHLLQVCCNAVTITLYRYYNKAVIGVRDYPLVLQSETESTRTLNIP